MKLIEKFGAGRISDVEGVPDFYTFSNGLMLPMASLTELPLSEPAILTTITIMFQREYGVNIFMPISDDESYVSGKVDTQETADFGSKSY